MGTQANIILNLANSVCYKQDAELKPQFVSYAKDFYEARIAKLDFNDPGSVETVNAWANQNTHGRIKTIVDEPLSADTKVLLAKAIYFKGHWLEPFQKRYTQEPPFHLPNRREKQIPMMERSGSFS
jgi:serpin B